MESGTYEVRGSNFDPAGVWSEVCCIQPMLVSPEFFVFASSVALGVVLVLLTVATQLQLDVRTWHRAWRVVKEVCSCLWARRGKVDTAAGRLPGKKARRTQRRRERRAIMKDQTNEQSQISQTSDQQPSISIPASNSPERENATPSVESSYRLYESHLQQEKQSQREALRSELQAIRSRTLHFPCSGCGVVNAKKNCSYNCCASCCRSQSGSVCRAHGTGYQAAVAAVEGAVQYGYREFDLSYGHLRKCPPAITAIGAQLVSLNLSNNRLSSLPDDIGVLSSLKELFLQYNNLTELPGSVCDLHQLIELDIKNNRLVKLPSNIGKLRRLVILNITNNHITHLPTSIGRLIRLEELGLHSNQLTQLPDEICNLTSLRIMYGGENRFRTLPDKFGQLWQLQELDVSGCELEVLPESLSQCVSIVRLWLSNNRLQTLPICIGNLQQLKELHVRNNRLKCLPASIEQLQLYTFTAQNNSFVSEHTAHLMCHNPKSPIPPLLEMAARAVLKHNITWNTRSLPSCLKEMLLHPSWCSVCGGPFFQYYFSHVTFKTIGVFYRIPLYKHICLPHLSRHHN